MADVVQPFGTGSLDPSRIVYPPWMDGLYVGAASSVKISDTVALPMSTVLMVPGNAKRWGFGILYPAGLGASLSISPDPRPDLFPLISSAPNGRYWFTLFEFGPIITGQLYVYTTTGGNARFIEVEV